MKSCLNGDIVQLIMEVPIKLNAHVVFMLEHIGTSACHAVSVV